MTITKDQEIELRGCSPVKEIIIPNQGLVKIIDDFSNLPIATKKYQICRMNLDNIIYDGHYFLDSYFKLHSIPHLKVSNSILGKKTRYTIKDIHPYKLPLALVKDAILGQVEETFLPNDPKIYFQSIALVDLLTEMSSSSYVHEVTHTQLDSQKGIYTDYFNQEVLSIFLQLFHSALLNSEESVLRLLEANRIYELNEITKQQLEYQAGKIDLSREDQIENSKYIQSDMIALNLFAIYYHSFPGVQREMLVDVQKIFDGRMTVEEYLNKYDSSFTNCLDSKTLRKHLHRS